MFYKKTGLHAINMGELGYSILRRAYEIYE